VRAAIDSPTEVTNRNGVSSGRRLRRIPILHCPPTVSSTDTQENGRRTVRVSCRPETLGSQAEGMPGVHQSTQRCANGGARPHPTEAPDRRRRHKQETNNQD
jgi:hypothetical protein